MAWFRRRRSEREEEATPATVIDPVADARAIAATLCEELGWPPQRGFGVPWMVPYWQLGGELTSADEKQASFNNDKAIQVFEWFLKV